MVRDAMIRCFYDAHCADTGLEGDQESNRVYCRDTVVKAFHDAGEDFDHPTKTGIIKAMSQLREFSKNFRDPSIIEKHAAQISQLVERIK